MPHSVSRASRKFLMVCLLLTLAAPATVFAQATDAGIDTWLCLPEETAFAVRIPQGRAFAEAFVENTKFGAVLFNEERRAAVTKALAETDSDHWSQFQEKLSEYGLSFEELWGFLAGESGYAVVVADDDDSNPVALGLAWLEPGEELASRAYDIIVRMVDEQEDQEHPVSRVDLELADRPVMQLMLPQVDTEYPEELDLPEEYYDLPEDEQEVAWDQAYEVWKQSAVESVSYHTALAGTLGGRVFLAHSFQPSDERDEHPDSGRLADLFARLLAEHQQGEGGFVARLLDDPGVAQVSSLQGMGCLELAGDSAALTRFAFSEAPNKAKAEQIERILGLFSLGPFALKSTLDGTYWHTQFSLSLSTPRQGLVKLLEQPLIEVQPPGWAPASVITYSQFSFDLGEAYALIKELVTREFPDQAQKSFGLVEMQVFGFAEANLEEVLSSLGTRHTVLNFERELDSSADLESQGPESTAIVWQVKDEQLWSRMMKAFVPMVGAMQGVESTDEQGYSGFRFQNEVFEAGLLLGNGNLVLAIGPQVLETTLSALNSPPQGSAAFRGSEVYQRATDLLEPAPSIGYKVVDGNRYSLIVRKWLLAMLKQVQELENAVDEDAEGTSTEIWIKLAQKLMPTDGEIKDIMGVVASRWEVNENGLLLETVQEMPPPDEQ